MGSLARKLKQNDLDRLGISEIRLNGELVVEVWANEETEELAPFVHEWRRDGQPIHKVWATAVNAPLPGGKRVDQVGLLAALWLIAAGVTAVLWVIWHWLFY
jgi:hypothetical protein